MRPFFALSVMLAGTVGSPALAQAQTASPPDPKVASVFTKDTQRFVCPAGRVLLPPVLGEIAKNFDINPYALPAVPASSAPAPWNVNPASGSAEVRLAAWIIAAGHIGEEDAIRAGLTADQLETLSTIRWSLSDYLIGLSRSTEGPYRLASTTAQASTWGADRSVVVARFFTPLLDAPGADVLQVACAPTLPGPTPVATQPGTSTDPEDGSLPSGVLTFALRGEIDDLAVPRLERGKPGKAFEKASDATLAFTDNDEKGEQTVAIEAVVGLGFALTDRDGVFGFVHYTQNSTETSVVGDDDDAKDIRALSPGLLWSRSTHFGGVWGTLGASLYPTFDFAQDSEIWRGRLFLRDISLGFAGKPICDAERQIFSLVWKCRLGVSAEWAYVSETGRSEDLQTLDDDRYFGVGADAAMALSVPFVEALKPFAFNVEYRYLAITSGGMSDPSRFTLRLDYKVPDSNIVIGVSRVEGENFETFQHEELTKFTVGFKY